MKIVRKTFLATLSLSLLVGIACQRQSASSTASTDPGFHGVKEEHLRAQDKKLCPTGSGSDYNGSGSEYGSGSDYGSGSGYDYASGSSLGFGSEDPCGSGSEFGY